MDVTRRSALQLAGVVVTTGIAGCSSIGSAGPTPPTIETRQITADSAQCVTEGTRQHAATVISYEASDHRLTFEGTTKTPSPCADLALTAHTGVGREEFSDDSIHITVDRSPGEGCSDCPAEISYSATTEFDNDPSKIYIYHVEKIGDEWKRVGPITTKNIS